MFLLDTSSLSQYDKTTISCDVCENHYVMQFRSAKRKIERDGKHICKSCSFSLNAHNKPQCTKSFWNDPSRKKTHGEKIKFSESYKNSITKRDTTGEKNGMFGKTHDTSTIEKMIVSRTSKKQSVETVRRRIETRKKNQPVTPIKSLSQAVKGYMNSQMKWSRRVMERDDWKCTKCESTLQLDAHHINPMAKMIKMLLQNHAELYSNDSKFEYLIQMPEILDVELKNGTTLCRKCHREVHGKTWGSHSQI